MGGGGKTVIEQPERIDVNESMRDYLTAITDPELVGKQLDAERIFGPQFDAVSLARTQTMLQGMKPKESQAYLSALAKRSGLEAKKIALENGTEVPSEEDIKKVTTGLIGEPPPAKITKRELKQQEGGGNRKFAGDGAMVDNPEYASYMERYDAIFEDYNKGSQVENIAELEGELAEVNASIEQMDELPDQPGLLDLADEAADRMAALQDRVDTAKRTGDIADLEDLGPGLVEALRKADPQSTALADASADMAAKARARADDLAPTAERQAMGDIAAQSQARISELEALQAEDRSPAQNEELQRLKSLRDRQEGMLAGAEARAADPYSVAGRAQMGFLAGEDVSAALDASRAARDPSQLDEFRRLQALGELGMSSAFAAEARALDPTLAAGRGELGQLADIAQQQALDPTLNAERSALGRMAFEQAQRADAMYGAAGGISPEQQRIREQAAGLFDTAGVPSAAQQTAAARTDALFEGAGAVSPEQQADCHFIGCG